MAAIGPDIALIAGAAGGGAAALLLVGLAVFFVCRARKAAAPPLDDDVQPPGSELRESNYGAAGLALGNDYDVGNVPKLPPASEYGVAPRAAGGGIQAKQTGVGTVYTAL